MQHIVSYLCVVVFCRQVGVIRRVQSVSRRRGRRPASDRSGLGLRSSSPPPTLPSPNNRKLTEFRTSKLRRPCTSSEAPVLSPPSSLRVHQPRVCVAAAAAPIRRWRRRVAMETRRGPALRRNNHSLANLTLLCMCVSSSVLRR